MGSKLFLIDSNNIAYRAFYALPASITTSTGVITNAVYGFTSMILKVVADFEPDTIVAAFDSKSPTFRHELFTDYKAQRKKMPDELISQIPLIKEVLDAMNISSIEVDGFEADDIIASIASKSKKKYDEILIVSSDKDLLQLVKDNTRVIALKKGITDIAVFNADSVYEKFDVGPSEIQDYLALAGDTSDNIPGVPGIGPKTASQLIRQFKTLDNIFENIAEIKSKKLAALLLENKENVQFSKKLTHLADDLELDTENILSRRIRDADSQKIQKTFQALEFRTLLERIKKAPVFKNSFEKNEKSFTLSENNPDFLTEEKYKKDKKTGETDNNTINCTIALSSHDIEQFLEDATEKIYFDITSSYGEELSKAQNSEKIIQVFNGKKELLIINETIFKENGLENAVKKIFGNERIAKTGFDIKNKYKWLKENGVEIKGSIDDLKIIFLLLNSVKTDTDLIEIFEKYYRTGIEETTAGLKNISFKKPDKDMPLRAKISHDSQQENQQMSFGGVDDSEKDTKKLWENFKNSNAFFKFLFNEESFRQRTEFLLFYEVLAKNMLTDLNAQGMTALYRDIEEPLIKVLAEMEYRGVTIDKEYLKVLIPKYDKEIETIREEIYKLSGEEFNINSPQQLSKVLYQKLKLQPRRKTKTGLSTDAATLISLIDSNPIIEKILDYREKMKLKNTYIDVLPKIASKKDGRVHTTYNQLGTTTGRMSSSEPNLQNIPVRTEIGRLVRKAFIPGKGYDFLLSADYSQIELRVLAHLSGDKKLIEVFSKDEDIHRHTAAEIFNKKPENVTDEMRRKAKAINFGIIYGMTEYGLKARLSITEEEAKNYIELYFSRYPEIKGYINSLIKRAYEKGYTETLFGRKRNIPELFNPNPRIRNLGERLAVNTPIQGTAADIMKIATVRLFDSLKTTGTDANILMQVHDELVLEFKEKDLDAVMNYVKTSMEDCVKLKIPLKTDIKYAKNWYI